MDEIPISRQPKTTASMLNSVSPASCVGTLPVGWYLGFTGVCPSLQNAVPAVCVTKPFFQQPTHTHFIDTETHGHEPQFLFCCV